jgi:sialidase-1
LSFQSKLYFILSLIRETFIMQSSIMQSSNSSENAVSRRTFLHQTAAGVVAGSLAGTFPQGTARAAVPEHHIRETRIISPQAEYYHGWSTVARRKNGELWLVWSGGREAHVCPFGQVVSMTSRDEGQTWTWPRVLLDSALDDRDAGVLETAGGTLLVTTFSSLAYVSVLESAEQEGDWPSEKLSRWQAAHRRISPEAQQRELGQWMLRSTDGGITWSPRYSSIVSSPHGPIQLGDGRQLYVGKEIWTGQRRLGVCESTDDGQTWNWLVEIPTREGDEVADYHEPHAVECADGRILVHVRNHNQNHERETLQCESLDGGKTWSELRSIGVWGLPSHLLRLRDGRLVMSYGYRRQPFGNHVRISEDHGETWSEPITLSADGDSGDLGYPSTVELEDGMLLTIWYERLAGNPRAVLRQARWTLG